MANIGHIDKLVVPLDSEESETRKRLQVLYIDLQEKLSAILPATEKLRKYFQQLQLEEKHLDRIIINEGIVIIQNSTKIEKSEYDTLFDLITNFQTSIKECSRSLTYEHIELLSENFEKQLRNLANCSKNLRKHLPTLDKNLAEKLDSHLINCFSKIPSLLSAIRSNIRILRKINQERQLKIIAQIQLRYIIEGTMESLNQTAFPDKQN